MQEYVTIATGAKQYLDMAVNLALSIRHFAPRRPVGLVHDAGLSHLNDELTVFDRRSADLRRESNLSA